MIKYSISSCWATCTSGLDDRVEQELGLQGLAGLAADLGAVLVVVQAVLALEVLVHLRVHERLGHGDLDGLQQLLEDLVAGLHTLLEDLGAAGPDEDVRAHLLQRLELAGLLGEVVIEFGQLALLDRGEGHGDL